ncbi:MAG TPA: hypothetical protein VGO52_01245 [Hyphomonadaceae bacterium]|nr:hypothetical protein [Hyphomonadaceae bacterium]
MMRTLILTTAILAGLGLAACTDKGAADPTQAAAPPAGAPADQQATAQTPAGPPSVNSTINWDAARADLAKRPASVQGVTIQSAGNSGPPPVPMLLPSGVVSAQSADRPTPPVVTDDGYFATYHLAKYDAIVNGSNKAYTSGQPATGAKDEMKFQTGEASASLSFQKYGASYTIDFECRQVDGGDSCITEKEARDFADSLFVAQTQ